MKTFKDLEFWDNQAVIKFDNSCIMTVVKNDYGYGVVVEYEGIDRNIKIEYIDLMTAREVTKKMKQVQGWEVI